MNISVILTGGIGKRMSLDIPKQFIQIDGIEVFVYTIKAFLDNQNINRCVLVINSSFKDEYDEILRKHNLIDKVEICFGGETRQESSFNAIKYLKDNGAKEDDIILIHDGARPLVDNNIINQNISLCNNDTVVSTVVPMVDTLVDKNYNVIDRNSVFGVQTPQTFMFKNAFVMHEVAVKDGILNASDDIQLAKRLSLNVAFAKGSRRNVKITTLEDIYLLESYLRK